LVSRTKFQKDSPDSFEPDSWRRKETVSNAGSATAIASAKSMQKKYPRSRFSFKPLARAGFDVLRGNPMVDASRLAMVGYCFGGTVAVPSVALVGGEQSIVANLVGTWIDLWEILQLQAAGRLILKAETHPLDTINDVLDKLREGEVIGRAVLVP